MMAQGPPPWPRNVASMAHNSTLRFDYDRWWRILIVEDEDEARATLIDCLTTAGHYDVIATSTAKSALLAFAEQEPDLVIVDLGLPDVTGLDVLRNIRNNSGVPVIILTARNDESTRVLTLEMGADDYVLKPFSVLELQARVKAALRRTAPPALKRLVFDRLEIDLPAREVFVEGRQVTLTAKEFDLLAFMAASPRQVFTSTQLLAHVWEIEPGWQSPATVKEHIHRLRAKLEPTPKTPRHVVTVQRVGYRFDP